MKTKKIKVKKEMKITYIEYEDGGKCLKVSPNHNKEIENWIAKDYLTYLLHKEDYENKK